MAKSSILPNTILAGSIYLLATVEPNPTAQWVLYGTVAIAAFFSVLSVFLLAPLSTFWALITDSGFKEALEKRILRKGDESTMDFILAICELYSTTEKVLQKVRSSQTGFYLHFLSSAAVSLAIVLGPGWTIIAAVILVLDCIAYGCIAWLAKNFTGIAEVTYAATGEAIRIDPSIEKKGE